MHVENGGVEITITNFNIVLVLYFYYKNKYLLDNSYNVNTSIVFICNK
jgi:hypothetical protein